MKLYITRKTGFYGMATPITILKNGKKWFAIGNNSTKTVEVLENELDLQVSFYLLKSEPFHLKNDGLDKELKITMNPMLVGNYLIFFVLMLLIPATRMPLIAILLFLVLYFVFLITSLKKAYVIKEKSNGT
ncbi:hypothetical protein [Enterococcus sp. LJL51]|uniref:hypothetical protein n=1 Tax=Enterococcus sp. LJL51 TaxID=3416656 RepID=UPI003CEA2425